MLLPHPKDTSLFICMPVNTNTVLWGLIGIIMGFPQNFTHKYIEVWFSSMATRKQCRHTGLIKLIFEDANVYGAAFLFYLFILYYLSCIDTMDHLKYIFNIFFVWCKAEKHKAAVNQTTMCVINSFLADIRTKRYVNKVHGCNRIYCARKAFSSHLNVWLKQKGEPQEDSRGNYYTQGASAPCRGPTRDYRIISWTVRAYLTWNTADY